MGWRAATKLSVLDAMRPREMNFRLGEETFAMRVGRGQSDLQTLIDVWVQKSYAAVQLDEPTWIVDAGANVGYSARWFGREFPAAKIIAIEPDPENFRMLLRNTAKMPQVVAIRAALTAQPTRVRLQDPGGGGWAIRTEIADDSSDGTVRGMTVSEIMAEHGIGRIDLLKVDIEGAEREVLEASSDWMPHVDALVAELHDRWKPGCMRAFMAATAGFPTEIWHSDNVFVSRRRVEPSAHPSAAQTLAPRDATSA